MLDTVDEESHWGSLKMRIEKQELRALVEDLPDEVEIEEVLYRLYLRGKLEAVEEDVREDAGVSNADVGRLLGRALRLDEGERADLAGRLLDSLDDTEADIGVEEAWRDEVTHRMTELDEGVVKPVSWEEVQARVFGRSRGRNGS